MSIDSAKHHLQRFLRDEQGQDLIEYALLCLLLTIACIVGIMDNLGLAVFIQRLVDALAAV